jgi:putative DNA primase/helicase
MKSEFKTENNLRKFKANMAEKGLLIDEIIPDGKIHRFQVVNRIGKPARDGWYVYFDDGCPSGAFGNWRTGEKWRWCSKNKQDLTQAEREAFKRTMADVKQQREKVEADQHQKAKDIAIKIWEKAKPVKDHPYLTKKQVADYGLRQDGNERRKPNGFEIKNLCAN